MQLVLQEEAHMRWRLFAPVAIVLASFPLLFTLSLQTGAEQQPDENTPSDASRRQPLTFAISLPKQDFALGEQVPLTMTLQNASTTALTVNRRLAVNDKNAPRRLHEVSIFILAPSGEEAAFDWDLRIGLPRSEDFSTLAPGDSVQRMADLTDLYILDQRGEYLVFAIYENTVRGPRDEQDVRAVRTSVTSSALRFRIG